MPDAGAACTQGELEAFARALFAAAGMDADKAATTARLLVLTDAMGRRTHGLAMAPTYLAELARGGMKARGEPEVLRDNGLVALWDGRYLPGLWLVHRAMAAAMPRARERGLSAVAIRRSHHIGCLAVLVREAAEAGLVAQLWNSDPAGARMAPYGGTEPLFTPDPFAMGYPGTPNPVLVDISASITTTSMTRRKVAAGERFEHPWLLDAEGRPTDDPRVLEHTQPRGSLLPVGGTDHGHKGYGLALMNEALSQGLAGHGRRDAPGRWGGNVYLQLTDPAHFAGLEAFTQQTDHIAARARASRPIDPERPVRVPGDQAARGIAEARANGIRIDAATWQALRAEAERLRVPLPKEASA